MSALIGLIKTSEIDCPINQTTTLTQMQTPTTQRAKILSWGVSFINLAPTGSVLVNLLRHSDTGINGTVISPVKMDDSITLPAIQTTALQDLTTPTSGDVLKSIELEGGFQEDLPFNQEYIVGASGYLGIECNPSNNNYNNTIKGVAWIRFEE